jgi:hypothetical protein
MTAPGVVTTHTSSIPTEGIPSKTLGPGQGAPEGANSIRGLYLSITFVATVPTKVTNPLTVSTSTVVVYSRGGIIEGPSKPVRYHEIPSPRRSTQEASATGTGVAAADPVHNESELMTNPIAGAIRHCDRRIR